MTGIADNTPVLVGCGQITQREPDPAAARNPLQLTADAARAAADDSGAGPAILQALDAIVVIRSFADTSWRFACPFGRFENMPQALGTELGANAGRLVYTEPGGNMPQWSVNRLAGMIRAGQTGVALIAGGEALATQKAARRAGLALDWHRPANATPESWGIARRGWSDPEDRHGMRGAIFAYPLFEQAIRAHRGRSLAVHQQAMGELLARFAAVAAANPLADRRDGHDAATIATPTDRNPYIGFPYTRLMNANAYIDQSAALILTSAGRARALGVPRERWVFLHGHADAHDHWYITERRDFHSSPAMHAVFARAMQRAACGLDEIDHFDIYSCFASAVEVGCEALGLAETDARGLTVTGGLPFFGGPGNNYVTHAIAQMMVELRARPGSKGLVTANGNYLTKHSAGIYSTEPGPAVSGPCDDTSLQHELDAVAHPELATWAQGRAHVETWTVMHDRDGPTQAIVIGRLEDGRRFIANTPADRALLEQMTREDMIGRSGRVGHDDERNRFVPD